VTPRGADVLRTAAPSEPSVGLYVHVPFCALRCHFCSFTTAPLREGAMARYLEALHREIELVATSPWADGLGLDTIFLGGGTPSLLEPDELAGVLSHVGKTFAVTPGAEITLEANPESVERAKLEGYRAAGLTRLSLGVESLDDAILPRLNRRHDAAAARRAFEAAREAAVPQVSVDLMYGLPWLDVGGWTRAVETVLAWRPDHLSAYGMTLDSGSRWGSEGAPPLPAEETTIDQYWVLARAAGAAGFEHYEISNYARAGCRSRHNERYWRHREYLALGPGACGFIGDVRYGNVKAVERYGTLLAHGELPLAEHERLTPRQVLGERLMLGLRTADGVPVEWLEARAAGDPALGRRLAAWSDQGLLERGPDRARLTEEGFLLSDELFVELL
jgi:oxygen-independent coproporphyrinogen-3 oxidase